MELKQNNNKDKDSELISIIRNIKDRVTKGFFLMLEIGVGLICFGALIACLVLLYMNSKGGF